MILSWRDLITLRCIIEASQFDDYIEQVSIGRTLNKFIQDNDVPDTYGSPVLPPHNIHRQLSRLRQCGLLTSVKAPIRASEAGIALNKRLSRDWRYVPTRLPCIGGKPDMKSATYIQKRS